MEKYYSTGRDLTISIIDIKANSIEEAEAVLQRFISKIAKVMEHEVRWDEADWSIQENTLDEQTMTWEVTDEYDYHKGFPPLSIFGWHIEDGVICPKCGITEEHKTLAEPEGYPDGYTCLLCGDTVGAENYKGE